MALTVMALAGCGDSLTSFTPVDDPYLSLELNVRRAVMSTAAPYNTLQLVPTPRTASGAVLTDSLDVQYVTRDTTLRVTSDGLVTALYTTANTWVLARVRDLQHGITRVDTLFVRVTATTPPSPLATFVIHRPPGDSAKVSMYDSSFPMFALDTLHVAATAEDGTDLTPDVWVRYAVSDSSIAKVHANTGVLTGLHPGQVMVYATTTYYGVTKTDSLQMTIGNPLTAIVTAEVASSATVAGQSVRHFVPETITIGVGGIIYFRTDGASALEMDVVFDDPSAVQPDAITGYNTGSGNIGPLPPLYPNGGFVLNPACVSYAVCSGETRSFPVAGTYHYHSALYGTSGTIIVTAP
jgi:hypothetical protein